MFGKLETEESLARNNRLAKRMISYRDKLDKDFKDMLDKHVGKDGIIPREHYLKIKTIEDRRDKCNLLALRLLMKGRVIWRGLV